MEPTALEQALFRTLAYFAYFQFPLTLREMHTWLLAPDRAYHLDEVEKCITNSTWLKKHSERYGVYISLKSCEDWVKKREKKYLDAQRKHKKALFIASLLMRIPGIVGVAVCNSLAWHATTKESDIDLFIVTRPGKIWTSRLFATLPLRLLGMRPGEAIQDPLCLSFFVDENSFAFASLREGEEDWYLAYWCASLLWIGGAQSLSKKFFAQNEWMQHVLPNACPTRPVSSLRSEGLLRLPLFFPESFAKKIQERLFSQKIRAKQNQSTHVIINDQMLKFHDDDRRAAISAFVRLHMQQAGL